VTYVHLDREEKAKIELQELLVRYPDFMEIGEELLLRHLGDKKIVTKLWDTIVKVSSIS
jgi:hypothetical protein